ncbi:MAG: RsmB/NOP family class I SAM-dependent RNA methyltransferase [Candidatus Desulfofervidaceae bacterium]|nr:RsmB/NOP family class I SAM-dependent RNA methyltransferase [Candidatus Desulfofervidaceae bacterium]MDL1969621.1 RsmB/NOP family class I SAM-dependent RNA methyltransferase [Candidatus Desulfofervidaceae bacterium]
MDYLQPETLLSLLMGEEATKTYLAQAGRRILTAIRLNPLKARPEDILHFLQEDSFKLTPLSFYPLAYKVDYEPFPISKSFVHFSGLIYLQDPSSMLPPLVLDPKPGEKVLDLTAAPGSKTTLLATLMQNQGMLVALDNSGKRLRALSYNLERWGVINAGWARILGEQAGTVFFECFDKVLVDPPCTALGTLHKSPEILRWWKEGKVMKLARIQERLLISGLKALKPGGSLVYSTCTLTPHENEGVINAILERYPVELEEISLPSDLNPSPGLTEFLNFKFPSALRKTVRLYPLETLGEGFYIAKLRKKGSFQAPTSKPAAKEEHWQSYDVFNQLVTLSEHFGFSLELFADKMFYLNKHIRLTTKSMAAFSSPVPLQKGISFARPMGKNWRLTTNGITWLAPHITQNRVELDSLSLNALISGHNLPAPEGHTGQQLLTHLICPLGYGWIKNDRLISQLPTKDLII